MDQRKPLFDAVRAMLGRGLTDNEVELLDSRIDVLLVTAAPLAAEPVPHFDSMRRHLEREEGRVVHAYQDHLGYWTIGVGRLIDKRKGGRLTDEEIDHLLANDIRRFLAAMADWPAWHAVKDNPARATALLSMCLQMGAVGLAKFKTSLSLIAAQRWAEAGTALRQSLWARQTQARASRVIAMIETGRMA